LGKKQDKQSSFNPGSSSLAPIIDELVELNLSGRAQVPGDLLWRQINVQSLIAEKKAEIERTLGKDRAIELFRAVQVQVLKRIMAPDNYVNRDDGRANSDNSKRTQKVKVFKPTLKKDFPGHSDWVLSAKFSPVGGQVLTASDDKTAKLWSIYSEVDLESEIQAELPVAGAVEDE
jgi:WD40 repeat protein